MESVQSLEMSLRAMVAASESSGLVSAEVTMGVTCGSRWGWTYHHYHHHHNYHYHYHHHYHYRQPVGEAADAVEGGGDHTRVVVEGDHRELGQEERQQGVGILLLAVGQRLRHRIPDQ